MLTKTPIFTFSVLNFPFLDFHDLRKYMLPKSFHQREGTKICFGNTANVRQKTSKMPKEGGSRTWFGKGGGTAQESRSDRLELQDSATCQQLFFGHVLAPGSYFFFSVIFAVAGVPEFLL